MATKRSEHVRAGTVIKMRSEQTTCQLCWRLQCLSCYLILRFWGFNVRNETSTTRTRLVASQDSTKQACFKLHECFANSFTRALTSLWTECGVEKQKITCESSANLAYVSSILLSHVEPMLKFHLKIMNASLRLRCAFRWRPRSQRSHFEFLIVKCYFDMVHGAVGRALRCSAN